jgi:hypothetical protein
MIAMRTWIMMFVLLVAGCASVGGISGAGGGEVVSGEARSEAALTGSATDSVATNGSDTTGETIPSPARPNVPVAPAQ